METMTQLPPETNDSKNSLLIARLILRDAYLIVGGIRNIAAVLLRYAALGAAVTDGLVGCASFAADENR